MAQLCGLTITEDRFRAVIPGNFGSLHPDAPILSLLGQAGAPYINCLWSGSDIENPSLEKALLPASNLERRFLRSPCLFKIGEK